MATTVETARTVPEEEIASRPEVTLPIHEGRVFHFLRQIRLPDVYPFNLRGEDYLNSHLKRGMDVSLGVVGTVLFSPFTLGGMIAVKIESPHLPTIIKQERHGREGNVFGMYKIRSMIKNLEATGEIDPTRVGQILRATSVDELPQFLNVILGSMSLVGRRPVLGTYSKNQAEWMSVHLPYKRAKRRFRFTDEQWRSGALPEKQGGQEKITVEEIERYADEVRVKTLEKLRQFRKPGAGKPGVTGLYQILGRREIEEHHRIRLETFYEEHASLGLDLAILVATVPALLSRRGAV